MDNQRNQEINESQLKYDVYQELQNSILNLFHNRALLTKNEVIFATNLAFIEEMLRLLESDTNLYQTINSFTKQPYTPKDKQKRSDKDNGGMPTADRNVIAGLRRAASTLEANKILAKETRAVFRHKVRDPLPDESPNNCRKYSFIDLRFMELLYFSTSVQNRIGGLEIYNDLFLKRGPFDERIPNVRLVLDNLKTSYTSFGTMLRNITKNNSNIDLTVAYLQLFKFEREYRPILFAKIAEGLINRDMPINNLNFQIFDRLIKPYDFYDNNVYSLSPLVFIPENIIDQLFGNADLSNILFVRLIADLAYRKYNHRHRNDEFHWKDDDFEFAASFLKNNYPTEKWLTTTADWIDSELSFNKIVRADNPYFQIFRDERFVMPTKAEAAKEFLKAYNPAMSNAEIENLLEKFRCRSKN